MSVVRYAICLRTYRSTMTKINLLFLDIYTFH